MEDPPAVPGEEASPTENGEPDGQDDDAADENANDATNEARTLQTRGNTLENATAVALNEAHGLNLPRREWGRALEELKDYNDLPPNFHQTRIREDGVVIHTGTGEELGNLRDFLP